MKIQKKMVWPLMGAVGLAAAGSSLFLGGCEREAPVTVQAPAAPEQAAQAAAAPDTTIVQEAPPALIVERRPAPESANMVWVDGYWNWDNQKYNWQAGRYEVPPQADEEWIAPRYDHDARGYHFSPGQWSKRGSGNQNHEPAGGDHNGNGRPEGH